jgi:topoisomerase-4 subunit A
MHTRELLGQELQVRLNELAEEWHMASLERIFIQNKIYQVLEKCKSPEEAYEAVDTALIPFKALLKREVTREDVVKLTELKFIRITRYDLDKADNHIKALEKETKQVKHDLAHLTEFAIAYFEGIKERYGKGRDRKTEIRSFDTITQSKVAVVNSKLYVDREGGFFGIGAQMKQAEYVCDCSDMDDIIVFLEDGRYVIRKVLDKDFYAPGIIHVGVFRRGDERTIYNVLYRDGDKGPNMMKRCAISAITRDKEYNMTKGTPKSEILHLSVNPNGEAEVLKVYFKPRPRLKKVIVDLDFSTVAIKGRQSQGNLFSRYGIHKIVLKEHGVSTLGGQNIWYDEDVRRLNTDGRGLLLGEFKGEDKLVVWTSKNQYYITGFNVDQHFPDETIRVERYVANKVYSLCYFDKEQNYYYMKRFQLEMSEKMLSFLEEDNSMEFVTITDKQGATLVVTYKGAQATRPADEVDVDSFIGVKSHRAKGKRITTYDVDTLQFIEPEEPEVDENAVDDTDLADNGEPMDIADAMNIVAENGAADYDDVVAEEASSDDSAKEEIPVMVIDPEQLNLF